jgi:hypothetical protein
MANARSHRPRRHETSKLECAQWRNRPLSVYAIHGLELLRALPNIPAGSAFADLVGIVNIPIAVAQSVANFIPLGHHGHALIALAVRLLLTALVFRWAIELVARSGFAAAVNRLTDADAAWLVAGCLTMGACYLMAQNIGYRGNLSSDDIERSVRTLPGVPGPQAFDRTC